MAEVKNSFVGGRMEKDLDERLIPEGVYRDALNIDIDTDSGSNVGSARNSLGNTIVGDYTTARGMSSYDPSTDNARTIGAVKYEADNLLYWFVASDTFDGIFEYDEVNDVVTRVLVCTKASPTVDSTLRFNKRYLITGVNYIDGYLYWTDNYNPPRRINIARAKGYAIDDARIADDIDVIVKPPLDSPRIELFNDPNGTEHNNMEDKFLSFSHRYKTFDGQYSAMSPFSACAFTPGEYELDFIAGNNRAMTNSYNSVNISFNTGDFNVTEVQLLMYDVRSNNVYVVESFNKSKLSISDNTTFTFTFNNSKIYGVLDPAQLGRMFDNVPLKAKSQDFVGNRLMYGNYVQFYDMKDCNGEEINIDISVDYESTPTQNGTPIQTWRSDRDYEIGLEYLDDYGRSTTVFTSADNTIYIPPSQSDKGNSLVVKIGNPPPCWATHYRVLVKSSKKDYYNVFPILFYIDGAYRYFKINESDRDKIKVGGYVIFKSIASGPTYSNKKYKILEIDNKNSGFLTNGSGSSGLYFKVKTDSQFELPATGQYFYSSFGQGGGYFSGLLGGPVVPVQPLTNSLQYVEGPVHYGDGDPNAVFLPSNTYTGGSDRRIVVEAETSTTFRYYNVPVGTIGVTPPQLIASGVQVVTGSSTLLSISGIGMFYIQWNQSTINPGDRWVFNCRAGSEFLGDYARAIIPGDNWSTATPEIDRNIEAGAVIKMEIWEDAYNPSYPSQGSGVQVTFPPSPARFKNIEEWWYETNARDLFVYYNPDGNNVKGRNVRFRRGKDWTLLNGQNTTFPSNQITTGASITSETIKYPVRMIISSEMPTNQPGGGDGYNNNNVNKFIVSFEILQNENPLICETEPTDNNLEIYHETSQTYDITGGVHIAVTTDSPNNVNQTVTSNLYTEAIVKLNYPANENSDFNAWAFGNGLESDRIRDDWNAATLEFSPRVNSYVEDYRQRRSESAICYSGIYGENTGVDKLNEFNLSIANFKYLDKDFGSIQKLHAEDTNLLVLQENKVSRVLYGKNLLSDSVGGGSIVSIPEVLGSQIPYPGEWGISNNPESFAVWGDTKWFTDQRRGAVLQMSGDAEPIPISDIGMRDHFRDLMKDQPYDQKLGGFDPDKMLYTLAYNDESILDCELSLSTDQLKIGSAAATNLYLFTILTNVAWTVTVKDDGFGTGWITAIGTNSGYGIGNQDIYCNVAQNNTGAIRTVRFSVSYCDGLSQDFTLIQGRSRKGKIRLMVVHNTKY